MTAEDAAARTIAESQASVQCNCALDRFSAHHRLKMSCAFGEKLAPPFHAVAVKPCGDGKEVGVADAEPVPAWALGLHYSVRAREYVETTGVGEYWLPITHGPFSKSASISSKHSHMFAGTLAAILSCAPTSSLHRAPRLL